MGSAKPKNYPVLENYTPSSFMLPDSHYDPDKADRAVRFIEMLPHTKGRWAGKPFWLLPWQEQIIRDLFGIVKADGTRQFRMAYVEIPRRTERANWLRRLPLYAVCGRRGFSGSLRSGGRPAAGLHCL